MKENYMLFWDLTTIDIFSLTTLKILFDSIRVGCLHESYPLPSTCPILATSNKN